MRLLIVRHGDPDYTIDSLTEKGWREAELLADRMSKEAIDYFYVSPLGRARDTASCTLKKNGRTAEVCPWQTGCEGSQEDSLGLDAGGLDRGRQGLPEGSMV